MLSRSTVFIMLLGSVLLAVVSCAGAGADSAGLSADVAPDTVKQSCSNAASNRYLWEYDQFSLSVDGSTLVSKPVRDIASHWNVLKFLENGPCTNCVKIVKFTPSGIGTMLVDVQIKHPFQNKNYTGFDVRGIAIFTGSHAYPSTGNTLSDKSKGEGEVVNADGFTSLYNSTTAGSGPGGLQGYIKGKMAAPPTPTVFLSGFKRYISSDPANVRNAFYAGDTLTQTFEVDMADSKLGFGYAVDACWIPASVNSVVDPMTDFPPGANCPEPWKVDVSDEPVGTGLTDQGGSAKLTIDIYDWQGKTSHAVPVVECPELYDGTITGVWASDETGFSRWTANVENTKKVSVGSYKCLVSVEDNDSAGSPAWLNLTSYQVHDLTVAPGKLDHHELWYYHGVNLLPDASLDTAIQMLSTAKAAGYEKVVLADFKLGTIDIQSQTYWDHVTSYVQAAETAGIEIIPSLVPIGYSDALLCHDPNLIEGQPVKDCVFKVNGTTAQVEQDPVTVIANGDFENHSGDSFSGWNQMDGPGVSTFADTSVKHSGSSSMRFSNFSGNDRIRQDLTVKPWNCYAVSFWMKTENAQNVGDISMKIFSTDISRTLEFLNLPLQSTQDWTRHYIIFNSQDLNKVALYFGIWGGESGKFWIDDLTIENAGLINLIRRPGAPLNVTNEAGTITYTEGVDFKNVSDPIMGNAGSYTGTFDLYHTPPAITIKSGSKIKNGDKILVDYYHCVFVYDMQTACCLTEPAVFDIFNSTLSKVNELIHPTEVFIGVDEMRCANWCELCQSKGETPGQLLADATMKVDQIGHQINPGWRLMTWSDMYDPNHNAHDDYYLVNGTLANSWDGLPADWDIGNWLSNNTATISFFENHGNRQILCGYYDESGPTYSIGEWLDLSKPYPGVYACMYTSWSKGFGDLAPWAQAVKDWDAANW
jgi:hypothetical protein